MPQIRKQNLTVSLSPETVKKAKVLAAKRHIHQWPRDRTN